MPRYFFHIDGEKPHRDDLGHELRDDLAAWREGLRITRDIESALQPDRHRHLDIMEGETPVYRIEIAAYCRR